MLAWLEFKSLVFTCEQNGIMATMLGQTHGLSGSKIL